LKTKEKKMPVAACSQVASFIPIVPVPTSPARLAAGNVTTLPVKTSCSTCHLRELCLPVGLTGTDVERLDKMMFGRRRVKAGQTLYRQGDPFQFIYAVRGGTVKSSLTLADGREQVTAFYIAGEQLGLDGVADGLHGTTVTALEDSEFCAVPYANLVHMALPGSGSGHVIARLMSREIVREHGLLLLLGSMNAEERLAAFLLNLAGRLKARGYSSTEFHLRMTRAEIGSHLGMKLETVSRTFSAFQKRRLLQVDQRHIRIIDMEGLKRTFGLRRD
jgi:CRP/FNR family transcriptional regulator, anaerobic regulatory protein